VSFPQPPARPARPTPVAHDLLVKAARASGTEPHRIVGVEETDDGLIITESNGAQNIVVPEDRPDALGRTGVLMLTPPAGFGFPKGARLFAPHNATPEPQDDGDTYPWSVAELDELARRVQHLPPFVNGTNGASILYWVEGDPIKARAAWLLIARQGQCTPGQAAQTNLRECHTLRQIIVQSGWVADRELGKLDHDTTRDLVGWNKQEVPAC
jgi:hypothetical protein